MTLGFFVILCFSVSWSLEFVIIYNQWKNKWMTEIFWRFVNCLILHIDCNINMWFLYHLVMKKREIFIFRVLLCIWNSVWLTNTIGKNKKPLPTCYDVRVKVPHFCTRSTGLKFWILREHHVGSLIGPSSSVIDRWLIGFNSLNAYMITLLKTSTGIHEVTNVSRSTILARNQ